MARRLEAFAVVLATLWVGFWQAWWIVNDVGPRLSGDDVPVARATVAMFASITRHLPYRPLEFVDTPYPPAGMWLGAVGAMLLPGDPVQAMLLPQALLAAAIVPLVWFALRPTLGGPLALAAGALAPGYAIFWSIRGQFFLELHQGVALLLATVAWSRSDGLRRPRPSAALGLALGLGLLAKFSFVFFVAVPTVVAVGVSLARAVRPVALRALVGVLVVGVALAAMLAASGNGPVARFLGLGAAAVAAILVGVWRWPAEHARQRVVGALLVVAVSAAVCAPWYLQNLEALRHFLTRNLASGQFDGEVYPVAQVWWVLPGFVLRGLLDDAAAAAFVVGSIRVVLRKDAVAGRYALLAVVAGVILLSLQPYRTPRYTFPLGGAAIVVAAHAFLLPERIRRAAAGAILAWALWLQASVAFPAPEASMWWRRVVELPPNSEAAVSQQRSQLTSPHVRLRSWLQGPLRGNRAATLDAVEAAVVSVDLSQLAAMTATTLPPDTCERLALDLAARGANPYVRCGSRFGATLSVTPNGDPGAGWTLVAGTMRAQVWIKAGSTP